MKNREIIIRCRLGIGTTAKQAEGARLALIEVLADAGWRKPVEIEIVERP